MHKSNFLPNGPEKSDPKWEVSPSRALSVKSQKQAKLAPNWTPRPLIFLDCTNRPSPAACHGSGARAGRANPNARLWVVGNHACSRTGVKTVGPYFENSWALALMVGGASAVHRSTMSCECGPGLAYYFARCSPLHACPRWRAARSRRGCFRTRTREACRAVCLAGDRAPTPPTAIAGIAFVAPARTMRPVDGNTARGRACSAVRWKPFAAGQAGPLIQKTGGHNAWAKPSRPWRRKISFRSGANEKASRPFATCGSRAGDSAQGR